MVETSSPNLAAALGYISAGLAVFPLNPRAKAPATPDGFKSATKNAGRVHALLATKPRHNVAIATGKGSGVIVLDVDGDDGLASMRELVAQYGALPKTPTVSTGKGMHLYFRHPGTAIKNAVALRPGLDIRGDGGYVVAPPSVHPDGP